MADIFREVDEDLRRERYRKLWQKYGWVVIALALLIVIATAGYRGYEYYQNRQAAQAGARFQGAQSLLADEEREQAVAALQSLAEEGPGVYDDLAAFQLAGIKPDSGAEERAALFLQLAEASELPQAARNLARARAGYLLLDVAGPERVEAAVAPLNSAENPFRASALEVLALAAYKVGEREQARDYLTEIVTASDAPTSIVTRAQAYLDVMAGHAENVLELPLEEAPAAPALPGAGAMSPSGLAPLGGTDGAAGMPSGGASGILGGQPASDADSLPDGASGASAPAGDEPPQPEGDR